MESRLHRASLFVLYQLALLLGIVLMPVALVARQLGLRLPVHRVVTRVGEAYDDASRAP